MALLDFFIAYLEQFAYIAILVLLFIGSIGIPFPEEFILLAAGYVASLGYMHPVGAVLVSFAGVVGGDLIGYYIGHRGGWLLKHLLTRDKFRRVEDHFERHGSKTIFISRFLAGVRVFFPIAAGATRMRIREFMFWDMLAAVVWVPLVVLIGYFFGSFLPAIVNWFRQVDIVIGIAFAAFLILLLFAVKKRKVIRRKLEDIRHDFFTRVRKSEKPLEVLLFGNPKKIAQRVFSKQRLRDRKIVMFIEFLRDGKEVKCLHSRKWLSPSTYRALVRNWAKTLGRPERERWPTRRSVARRP